MCGISGFYSLSGAPIRAEAVTGQIDRLIHRGPDQGAIYLSPRQQCALGIRRLSIIDVAGGQQPLHNETGSIHLVYNGETYNHAALRGELEQLGHRPQTHNDGEVVLHGYEAWGPELVLQKMRGMAAFALWDEPGQQLFLARDRFGIKPLYYGVHAGQLSFGSEIKAILAQPNFPRRVNLAGLEAMLTLGFVPGPATMFEQIYKLPPAHYLLARAGKFEIKRYWHLTYQPQRQLREPAAIEQFLALLDEAVTIRLMSEVPLGALLSGGLDSSTIVALIQARLMRTAGAGPWPVVGAEPGHPLRTISIGFTQPAYDEAQPAQTVARFIGTDHHQLTFDSADFALYPQVMDHLEEPQCSATALPIYKLYRACRQAGLTVILTGEGADELLGGYHWHKGDRLMRPLLPLPGFIRHGLAASPWPMSPAGRRVLRCGAKDSLTRYQSWLEVGGGRERQGLLAAEVRASLGPAGHNPLFAAWAESWAELAATATPFQQMLWLESRTRLVDFINFEVDKMSMAHSIEARVPFLDHKLWEFCATVPDRYKLKGQVEKYLLRQASKHILPESTRTRLKQGLAAPYAQWLRGEILPEWAEQALSPASLKSAGLFAAGRVQQLRQAHQAGQPHLGALLMGVLSTQLWFDRFIRG
jgi:asparagine synthase (glutamine-hydrolysing)